MIDQKFSQFNIAEYEKKDIDSAKKTPKLKKFFKWFKYFNVIFSNFKPFKNEKTRIRYKNYQKSKEIDEINLFVNFTKYSSFIALFFYFPIELLISIFQKQFDFYHILFTCFWIFVWGLFVLFLPLMITYLFKKYQNDSEKKVKVLRIFFTTFYTIGFFFANEVMTIQYKYNSFVPNTEYKLFWNTYMIFVITLPLYLTMKDYKYLVKLSIFRNCYFAMRMIIGDYQNATECIKTICFALMTTLILIIFLSFKEKLNKENFKNYDYSVRINKEWKKIFFSLPQSSLIISQNFEILYYSNKFVKEKIDLDLNDLENIDKFFKNSKITEYKIMKEDQNEIWDIRKIINNFDLYNEDDLKEYLKFLIYPKDNSTEITIELKVAKIDFEMKKCYLFLFDDISERNLIHVLQNTNEFKNKLINSFSHELKTPLNGANIPLEECLKNSNVSEDIKINYLAKVKNSLFFLEIFINDIIDFGSLSANNFYLFISQINVGNLIKEIVEIIEPMAKIKGLNFSVEIEEGLGDIENDKIRIIQIVMNLLRNAIKFTYKGEIVLKATKEVMDDSDQIKIEVKDTGIGMKNDQKQQLNNLLQNHDLSNFSKLDLTGGGLGLIISQNIAKRISPLDNGIQFTTNYELGSSFWFYIENKSNKLVIFDDNSSELMSIKEEKYDWDTKNFNNYLFSKDSIESNRKLLLEKEKEKTNTCDCPNIIIVDDESFNILAIEMLIKIHFKVNYDKAFNGIEALKIFEKYRKKGKCRFCNGLKFILMDIQMPGMNGIETTKNIREIETKYDLKEIPIIACTAYNSKADVDKCFEAGINEFVCKPITFQKMSNLFSKYYH